MTTLERDLLKLQELVDGHQPWSHRSRLHDLRDNDRGVKLAAEALKAYRENRGSVVNRVREWGAFVLAAIAILLQARGR